MNLEHIFTHPKNITIGVGRVIWALKTQDATGINHPDGWVLPGGQRTTSREIAEAVARNINSHAINHRFN